MEALKLAKELIRIRSDENTREIAEFVKDYISSFADTRIIEKNGVYNAVSEVGNERPGFVLNGHYDVVPPGEG